MSESVFNTEEDMRESEDNPTIWLTIPNISESNKQENKMTEDRISDISFFSSHEVKKQRFEKELKTIDDKCSSDLLNVTKTVDNIYSRLEIEKTKHEEARKKECNLRMWITQLGIEEYKERAKFEKEKDKFESEMIGIKEKMHSLKKQIELYKSVNSDLQIVLAQKGRQ